jgi:hypothetical protein
MWKLIFLGLIIWLVIHIIKRGLNQSGSRSDSNPAHPENSADPAKKPADKTEDMVQCSFCAVHLPRSEAFLVDDQLYCSKEHLPKK